MLKEGSLLPPSRLKNPNSSFWKLKQKQLALTKSHILSLMMVEPLDSLTPKSIKEIPLNSILKKDKSQLGSRTNLENLSIWLVVTTSVELVHCCTLKDIWVVSILLTLEMPMVKLSLLVIKTFSFWATKNQPLLFPKEMVFTLTSSNKNNLEKTKKERQANDHIFKNILRILRWPDI